MKRVLFLCMSICLLLCACVPNGESGGSSEQLSLLTQEENNTLALADTSYEEIPRVSAEGYANHFYAFENDGTALQINHPREWTFLKEGEVVYIFRQTLLIGEIFGGEPNGAAWTTLALRDYMVDGGSAVMHIERYGTQDAAKYRYRYVYTYVSETAVRTVTLTVDCAEVDLMTENKLLINTRFLPNSESATLGMLSHLSAPSAILILGNSFVGSSEVGNILSEMLALNGKSCMVNAVSRGMATVQTYAQDSTVIASIARGDYDMVFLCGFYSQLSVEHLPTLVNACEKSDTALVIFPAHNESIYVVEDALSRYKSVYCLHWKNELDGLISKGVSRWDLCWDDTYDHSKPLGGYVGAHMIYRAIYGELPAKGIENTLSQAYIDGILGEYASVGDIKRIDESKIFYFSE